MKKKIFAISLILFLIFGLHAKKNCFSIEKIEKLSEIKILDYFPQHGFVTPSIKYKIICKKGVVDFSVSKLIKDNIYKTVKIKMSLNKYKKMWGVLLKYGICKILRIDFESEIDPFEYKKVLFGNERPFSIYILKVGTKSFRLKLLESEYYRDEVFKVFDKIGKFLK